MSAMRFGFCREQKNASLFCVCCLRVPRQRGFGRSDKCTKGRTGPVSLWYEWCSKAAVSRNPKRPAAALGYGRCRGGMESSPFMTRRTSISVTLRQMSCPGRLRFFYNFGEEVIVGRIRDFDVHKVSRLHIRIVFNKD